ncbi:MAG: M48 family metalloprotease [Pseudomonadota bacterium]
MEANTEADTENSVDYVCIFIFSVSIFSLSIGALQIGGVHSLAVPFCIVALFLLNNVIKPVIDSDKLSLERSEKFGLPENVQIRESRVVATRAVDLWIAKYIVVNTADAEMPSTLWQVYLCHEYAHLKYNDTKLFNLVGVLGSFLVGLLLSMSLSIASEIFRATSETKAAPLIDGAVVFFIATTFFLYAFILWIGRSLHRREFRADRYAFHATGNSYKKWLERQDRRANAAPINFLSALSNTVSDTVSSFTHPPFAKRRAAIDDQSFAVQQGPIESAFVASAIFWASTVVSLALIQAKGVLLSGGIGSVVFDVVSYGLIIAGLLPMTISLSGYIRSGNELKVTILSTSFCVINFITSLLIILIEVTLRKSGASYIAETPLQGAFIALALSVAYCSALYILMKFLHWMKHPDFGSFRIDLLCTILNFIFFYLYSNSLYQMFTY